jgi:hypothetical protein
MKTIPELKKGDMINVNGEIYQLITHSDFAGSEKDEKVIELGRLGERNPTPFCRVIYPSATPTSMRLELFDKKTGSWREQKLVKFGF